MGLSKAHNVTLVTPNKRDERSIYAEVRTSSGARTKMRKREAQVIIRDGGSLVEVKRSKYKIPSSGGGIRGAIRTFSANSRRRLLRKMAELKRDRLPLFITLTYPDIYPEEHEVWKRNLRAFSMRLRRKYKSVGFIWRLELVERKSGTSVGKVAPHYHILIWGIPFVDKDWLSQAWYEIVGSGDEKHLRAGTQVKRMHSWKQTMGYTSKVVGKVEAVDVVSGEMAKESQTQAQFVGRWWGVHLSNNLPWAEKWLEKLTDREAITLIRYLRKRYHIKRKYLDTLVVYCVASEWLRNLDKLLYPETYHKSGELRSVFFERWSTRAHDAYIWSLT